MAIVKTVFKIASRAALGLLALAGHAIAAEPDQPQKKAPFEIVTYYVTGAHREMVILDQKGFDRDAIDPDSIIRLRPEKTDFDSNQSKYFGETALPPLRNDPPPLCYFKIIDPDTKRVMVEGGVDLVLKKAVLLPPADDDDMLSMEESGEGLFFRKTMAWNGKYQWDYDGHMERDSSLVRRLIAACTTQDYSL